MIDISLKFTPEELTAFFTGLSVLVISISAIVGIISLRVIAKAQQLEAVNAFLKDFALFSDDRKFVLEEFTFDPQQCNIATEDEKRVHNVINSLNRTCLLLEKRLLSYEFVFRICHTQIIRCHWKLKSYMRYHESRIGGRFGRRLDTICVRAKLFHDVTPELRPTSIKAYSEVDQDYIVIYKTKINKGWCGVKQKVHWRFRKFFKLY